MAWVGIVEEYLVHEDRGTWTVDYLIRHHYYNWVEDFGPHGRPIQLSPDGEGLFITSGTFKTLKHVEQYTDDVVGDLLIVYGTPGPIRHGVIYVIPKYWRRVFKQFVDADWFPYGRETLSSPMIPG